jgi:hypothetical protein
VAIRPVPRPQRGVVPGPSTADPAPRGCSAVAVAQRALSAGASGRTPALGAPTSGFNTPSGLVGPPASSGWPSLSRSP